MKGKRLKHRKKHLLFYKNFYKFNPPYSVLIDGTFCKAALQFKINIMEQMPKYLDAEVRYFTTKCVLAECEALGRLTCYCKDYFTFQYKTCCACTTTWK